MQASSKAIASDPVLRRFRQAVETLFPGRVDRVILYGSRARGDARPGSDYDLAVVLRDYGGTWPEVERLANLQWDLLVELDADLSALPFSQRDFEGDSVLVSEIKRDGVAI